MSKPGKSLKSLCKRLKVRLTVKRNGKRVYKSVKVLKAQCAKKKRRRKFGMDFQSRMVQPDDIGFQIESENVITPPRKPSANANTPSQLGPQTDEVAYVTPSVHYRRSYENPTEALSAAQSSAREPDHIPGSGGVIRTLFPRVTRDSSSIENLQDDYGTKEDIFGDERKEEDDGFGNVSVDSDDMDVFSEISEDYNNNNNDIKKIGLSRAAKKATKKLSKEEILSIVAITIGIGGLTTGILGLQNKLK